MKSKKISKLMIAGAAIAPIATVGVSLTSCSSIASFSFKDIVGTSIENVVFENNTLKIQDNIESFNVGEQGFSFNYYLSINESVDFDEANTEWGPYADIFYITATKSGQLIKISLSIDEEPTTLPVNKTFSSTINLTKGDKIVAKSELKFDVTIAPAPTPIINGTDLTELTKDEIQNLPTGTKFVFDLDMYISQIEQSVTFGDLDHFYMGIMGKTGADGAFIGNKDTESQQYIWGDAGGSYEYIYGSNGEDWTKADTFTFYKNVNGVKTDIEQLPEEFEGFCRIYKPTDDGYYESETGIAITDGYLDWASGVSAQSNEIKAVHFNWDSYYSRFQAGDFKNQYFLRYEIDSSNHIDFLWNANWNNESGYYSEGGKFAIEICLPDYTEYNPTGETLHVNLLDDTSNNGGHYTYPLGDWGEPTTGTFKIMNYSGEEGIVAQVYDPDWSGNTWTGGSPALDTGFVTLVK